MEEENQEKHTLTGVELYADNGSLNLDMFILHREIAKSLAPLYQQYVKEKGLDGYKFKHLTDEALGILFSGVICDDTESEQDLLDAINKYKHSSEFSDDDGF
jgi:hypothetical protein